MIAPLNNGLRKLPAWTIYIATAAYVSWQFWLAVTQQGPYLVEPINVLEREYGETALKMIIVGLLVTPLRDLLGLNLIKFRRAIGVSAFFLVLAHFLVWAVLDVQSLERIWSDILKRPYVTVGMLAFIGLIPLAVTSNNLAVRKMGATAWRSLHKLTYPVAVLSVVHYLWLVKGFQIEPIIYAAIVAALILWRQRPKRVQLSKA